MKPIEEKFWSNVERSGECWIWKAGKSSTGYGAFAFNGKQEGTHRVSWMLTHGPIPQGVFVCHNCPGGDNRSCVNPQHLFLGSPLDNMRDMVKKGRQHNQVKTQCKQGHEFTKENTLVLFGKHRYCLTCKRKRSLQAYYNSKAKSLNNQLQCKFS